MIDQLSQAYMMAHSKLLLLDYDGVLAPIVVRPEQARPTHEVLEMLGEITSRPGVKIVIISGRDQATLENWLGSLPVDMSAEHGHFYKESGSWHSVLEGNMAWVKDVKKVMEQLVAEYPGSHIESKQASLVWHYREVMVPIDELAARQWLEEVVNRRAVVMPGKCVIDVRAPGTDKGEAARHWYEQQKWNFVLCIGDDITDEAMFRTLPESAWTIKIGSEKTHARYQLERQEDVMTLLGQFAESKRERG